jgi:hypothetical protein
MGTDSAARYLFCWAVNPPVVGSFCVMNLPFLGLRRKPQGGRKGRPYAAAGFRGDGPWGRQFPLAFGKPASAGFFGFSRGD